MNRRSLLKNLALATTAAMLVPACVADSRKVSIALNNLNVNGDDEELLALIAETIIPKTDIPGAREVQAHLYTFVMIDDCAAEEVKEKFIQGLKAFDRDMKDFAGVRFSNATIKERSETLLKIEDVQSVKDEVRSFYFLVKRYIIEGYTSSEFYLTKIRPYQLVPGPNFKGCTPLTEKENIV